MLQHLKEMAKEYIYYTCQHNVICMAFGFEECVDLKNRWIKLKKIQPFNSVSIP